MKLAVMHTMRKSHSSVFALLLGAALLAAPAACHAQRTLFDESAQAAFRSAEGLYREGQYAAAERAFAKVENRLPAAAMDEAYGDRAQAAYYRAVCALELYNPDAEQLLLNFGRQYPDHPLVVQSHYQLGRYHFRNKKYRDAMDAFRQVDPAALAPTERMDLAFQLGYCFFHQKDLVNAKPLFAQVREGDSEYYYPANFYFGYIALEDGELDAAREAFDVAALSDTYAKTVPYFRARIAFAEGDYDAAIALAEPYAGQRRQPYDLELHQLMGQAWYAKGEHERALPFLQYYVDHARRLEPEDYYQLGVAQYKAGQFESAIGNLERLDSKKDSLAQHALYLVGDAHLKLDDREAARAAFQAAALMEGDPGLQRDARFLYAKLSYALGFHETAIENWQRWLTDYPDASNATEARELLVEALLRSRDFGQALALLETLKRETPGLQAAYQEVAFYRAVERYADRDFAEAEAFFTRSRKEPVDQNLDLAAMFWLGECALQQKDIAKGIQRHEAFQQAAGRKTDLPANASVAASAYSLGYAQLERERYEAARTQFAKVLDRWSLTDSDPQQARTAADAQLRLADCAFVLKAYDQAERAYRKISDARLSGSDYALFQRGMLQGLLNNPDDKTRILLQLHRDYASSAYVDDALYEAGNTFFVQGRGQSAEDAFQTLLREQPNGPFAPRALLKLALIAYTDGRLQDALAFYQQVNDNYTGSPEAREALAGIRDLSVDLDQPELYTQMGNVTISAKDSVTWDAAYQQVLAGNCAAAEPALERYILGFPSGYFVESARFYRAECRYTDGRYEAALSDYRFVLDKPRSPFRETALLKAARIAYFDVKEYKAAVAWYGELVDNPSMREHRYEALKGLVRSHYALEDYAGVLRHAPNWLTASSITPDDAVEAQFMLGKAAQAKGRLDDAYAAYGAVAAATTNAKGVESRFQRAWIEFQKGEYDKAKATCLDLIQETPAYESWVIRSYILIADVLREQGELVPAKAALRSIVDSYRGDAALLALAESKLAEIEAIERGRSRLDASEEDDFIDLPPLDAPAPTKPENR